MHGWYVHVSVVNTVRVSVIVAFCVVVVVFALFGYSVVVG